MGGSENTYLRSDDLMFLTSRSEEKRGHSTEIIFKTWFQKMERKGKLLLRESISSVLSSPSWPFKFWHQRFYLPDSLNHHCPTSTVHIQTKLIFAPNYKAFDWTVTLRPSVLTSGGEMRWALTGTTLKFMSYQLCAGQYPMQEENWIIFSSFLFPTRLL